MNIPEEFGKYLLLKKLSEDPLGETFRAGRWGQEGMEQVVLLRVFNGKGLDGEKLWQKISNRADIQNALRSPNIGSGVDLDRVRSYPYTAYDYISGKNLASLFDQASRQFSPIPADHALLIAERISLALAAAYETRVQDERVLHGFVVPHLVMISNEGETRLLGFEAAPGLRDSWRDRHGLDAELGRYLAPEALAGTPISKADDVYSLGVILFELLTGEHLPALPAGTTDYSSVIDNAMLGNEGTPLPPAVAALLKKSLVARDQRIADAVTWHKTLSKLMIDGHYSPTTFNLAFFMHGLFREEIERESQEIQAEKTLQLPRRGLGGSGAFPVISMAGAVTQPLPVQAGPAAAAGTGGGPAHSVRETTGVREVTLPGVVPAAASAEPSKKGLWIGIAAGLLVVAGTAGYFLFGGASSKEKAAAAQPPMPTPQTASMPGPAAPGGLAPDAVAPAPAGPTPDELKVQIQQMLDAQSQEMEAKLKTQYDDRIKQLQSQLADSRQASNEQERARAAAAERERLAAAVPPAPVETRRPEPAPPVAQPQQQAAPLPVQAQTVPVEEPGQPAQQQSAPVTPLPQPARPQVQYGDLVQGGLGVTPPKVRSQPMPRYPVAAQRFNKSAVVEVRVLVDEKGQVTAAERVGAKAGFGFDDAAVETARRSSFTPATKDGVRVKMWTVVKIAFKP